MDGSTTGAGRVDPDLRDVAELALSHVDAASVIACLRIVADMTTDAHSGHLRSIATDVERQLIRTRLEMEFS